MPMSCAQPPLALTPLALALLALPLLGGGASAQSLRLSVEPVVTRPGQVFTVRVRSNGGPPVQQVAFSLFVSPQVAAPARDDNQRIPVRTVGTAAGLTATATLRVDTLLVTVLSPAGPYSPGGPLLEVDYAASGAALPGSYPLVLGDASARSPTEQPVPVEALNGALTVEPGSANPGLYGDADADGAFTVGDVLIYLRASVGLETLTTTAQALGDVAPQLADGAFGDGRVDIRDVARLLRRLAGLEPDPWPGTRPSPL